MYKCVECGHLFEEGEEAVWAEDRGEFWGRPVTEECSGCPDCRGDYEEVYQCESCEEWFFEDEMYGHSICKKCYKEEEE